MFGFLGFILLFIIFIILAILGLAGYFIRSLFSFNKRTPKQYSGSQTTGSSYTSHEQTASQGSSVKKKIFGDDEGEYVEFEEIK